MPQNPQYKLVDSTGQVLGSIYATVDGEISIHHEASNEEAIIGSGGLDIRAVTAETASVSNSPTASTEVARQAEISTLDTEKADQTEVDTLSTTVTEKADQTTVDSLSTTVDGKADQTEVDTLSTTVTEKADQTEVDSLSSTVSTKADQDGAGTATLDNYSAVTAEDVNPSSQLSIPVYSSDSSAPNETHFFNDSDGILKYKDASGSVYGSSTDGGGTGSSYEGTEAIVTDGTNLQTALDNNQLVRIAGNIDVSAETPITVPQDTVVYGHGVSRNAATNDGDVVSDNSAGPTLHITGNSVWLDGFCIFNPHTDGVGIFAEGYSPNMHDLEIEAGQVGIRCGDSATDTTETEPRIEFCRIYGRDDGPLGDGSKGIHIESMYDAKVLNNIVAGFDIGIQVDDTETEVIGNHTYAFPRTNGMTVGLQINARWVRATHNRFEDSILGAGVRINNWFGDVSLIANRIQVGNTDVNGIEIETTDPSYECLIIANNSLTTDYGYGPGDTAIELNGADLYHSYVGGNAIRPPDATEGLGFSNQGDAMTQDSSPAASDHVPGVPIYDKSNDSIAMKTPAGMVTIGSP